MKRLAMVVLVAIFAAIVLAPAALALDGNRHDNTFIDTTGDDVASGHAGNDVAFFGRYGDDADVFHGGKGDDKGNVEDGDNDDLVSGDRGKKDVCIADAQVEIGTGCNKVVIDEEVL